MMLQTAAIYDLFSCKKGKKGLSAVFASRRSAVFEEKLRSLAITGNFPARPDPPDRPVVKDGQRPKRLLTVLPNPGLFCLGRS